MTRIDQPSLTDSDALWREFGADLMRFATVLVGPADAHDVAVDAFLRAAESIAGGGVVSHRPFLMRSVSNQANDLRRSRERRWRRDLAAIGPASAMQPDPLVDVRRAVSSLSLAQRTVIYFAYWEDLTEREIASVLGVSPGTVRRHLVRARIHLRRSLQ